MNANNEIVIRTADGYTVAAAGTETAGAEVLGTVAEILGKIFTCTLNDDDEEAIAAAVSAAGYVFAAWRSAWTWTRNPELIAAGTAKEVIDALENALEGVKTSDEASEFSVTTADGSAAGKIFGEYYGVIFAEANATLSLYPLDEDGEPDTLDDPIFDISGDVERFRVLRSNRYPLAAEHAARDLYDDLTAACRHEFEEWAAAHGYTHAGADVWEKGGKKFYLFDPDPTSDNYAGDVCIL